MHKECCSSAVSLLGATHGTIHVTLTDAIITKDFPAHEKTGTQSWGVCRAAGVHASRSVLYCIKIVLNAPYCSPYNAHAYVAGHPGDSGNPEDCCRCCYKVQCMQLASFFWQQNLGGHNYFWLIATVIECWCLLLESQCMHSRCTRIIFHMSTLLVVPHAAASVASQPCRLQSVVVAKESRRTIGLKITAYFFCWAASSRALQRGQQLAISL